MHKQAEKGKTERVTGLGRRTTREEIAKWNRMTALRFLTGGGRGGGETSDNPGHPSGGNSANAEM